MSTSSSLSVWIAHAQAQLDAATRALALRCASGARIDGAKADAWQVPSYELAWAAAPLLAARTLDGWLASADAAAPSGQACHAGDAGNTGNGGAMAQGLARLFIVEALVDVIARLEAMQMDLGLDGAALRAWAADAGWLRLRQQCAGQDAQKALGAAVAAGDAEIVAAVEAVPYVVVRAAIVPLAEIVGFALTVKSPAT